MNIFEFTTILPPLHLALTAVGFTIIFLVIKTYKPYKTFENDRTIAKPFLLVGIFIALTGITSLTRHYFFEWGDIVHDTFMFLSAVFFTYGIYSYQKMLGRLDAKSYAKEVTRMMQEKEP